MDVLGVVSGVLGTGGAKVGGESGETYVRELRERFKGHPMVEDLRKREEAFDVAAEKFAIAA